MTTYSTDPALFIFTSLTAGSSHIVTATSRLETILRANRVPFKAVDLATDQKARMLWSRRAGKDEGGRVRKLPGLVQEGLVLGDLVEIEDWNEYGELKQHVKIYYDEHTIPNIHHKHPVPVFKKRPLKKSAATPAASTAATPAASTSASAIPTPPPMPEPKATPASDSNATAKTGTEKPQLEKATPLPIRSVADEAAAKAKEIRLKSLREKVHGKEGAAEIEKAKKAEAEEKATPAAPVAAASVPAKKEPEEPEEEDSDEDDDDDDDDVAETEKAKKAEPEGKSTPAAPAAAAAAAVPAPVKKAKEESEEEDSDDSSEEDSSEEDSGEDSSDEDEKTTAKPKPKPAAITTTSTAATPSTPARSSSVSNPLSAASTKPPGLQSPTSGTWRHGSQPDSLAREILQSPTSGKWAQGATVGETMTLHGAEVKEVNEEEIKAVECGNVIKEEPELEEKEEKETAKA